MNTLSLRINAVKSDGNSKQNHQDLLQIDIEDFWPEDLRNQLMLINSATTTEGQLRELRKFAKLVNSENDEENNKKIASKLMSLYFQEPVKHPAKSTIQSCFNQSSEKDLIVWSICNEIKLRLNAVDLERPCESYHLVSCLNETSQNFSPAVEAIKQTTNEIVNFLKIVLQAFKNQLSCNLSPAEKNEVSHRFHSTLQAAIYCFKISTSDNQRDKEVQQTFNSISELCFNSLDDADLPMDTKSNCAMMSVMIAGTWIGQFITMINSDVCSLSKRLCLINGIVKSMNASSMKLDLLAVVATNLEQICVKSSSDPTLMLSIARSFMQLSKLFAAVKESSSPLFEKILQIALSVAFLNLEHHMDSVRHLSRETIRNVTEFCVNTQRSSLNEVFRKISTLPSINMKSIIVLTIAPVLTLSEIYRSYHLPGFNIDLLNAISDNTVTNHNLINCYEALAQKGLEDLNFDKWYDEYLTRPISYMESYPLRSDERSILENLLMRFVKKEVKVLEAILTKRAEYEIGFVLLCLGTGKKAGRFEKATSTDELWKGVISFKEIKQAMIHSDDMIRTSAMTLIAEARKTTDGLTEQELDCVMYFLKYNINVQSPSARQSILGMFKNMFVRIQAVVQMMLRKKEIDAAEKYCAFLINLQEFCLENLFEGANFSRRALSLKTLLYVLETIAQFFPSRSNEIWNQEKFNILIDSMDDSFENNKTMAVEAIGFIPVDVAQKLNTVTLEQLRSMVTSIKPPESLTASYLMEVYTRFAFGMNEANNVNSKLSPSFLQLLIWCEKVLLEGLQVAEKSLIVASSTNPLYGAILCIRHLVSKLDLKSLGACPLWREFFKRLIPLCKRLTLAVAPVVNNSSPEGILPRENIEGIDEETRLRWKNIIDQTTPQIILLCSWRTVKEVSLLLGDICLKAPLLTDGNGLLDVDQMLSIGEHFLELLSQTKHRGAFEQCFFGFSQYCLRLWVCHEPELHQLPSEMLQQMIASISGEFQDHNELLTMKNLCATRRSAGLPFMIQALITSELKVSTNKNFHFVMKNLIQFCLHGKLLETRTHSLNILRALFRCTDLNEAIGEYVADGIKVAILGYGADSWIERNSSTLLFSALMVRIFGVQRTKNSDDLHIRNRMTGRIFFHHYPELYDFFMTQLNEAAGFVNDEKMNAKLHPLLLLLIRLYPSALEGSESNLTLTGFIPVVTRCSGCVEMQTRILCAKFIASVTAPHLHGERITNSIEILKECESIPSNTEHGILLQILHLVKTMPAASYEQKDYAQSLMLTLDDLSALRQKFRSKLVCLGTFIDIITEVCEKVWDAKKGFCEQMIQHLDSCLDFDDSSPFGLSIILSKISHVRMMQAFIEHDFKTEVLQQTHCGPQTQLMHESLTASNSSNLPEIDFKVPVFTISTPPSDMHSILNTLLMILDFPYAMKMMDEYEINKKEKFLIEKQSEQRRINLLPGAKAKISLAVNITELLKKNRDYQLMIKAFDVISYLSYDPEGETCAADATALLIKKALSKPEHFKKALLKFANATINSESVLKIDFTFLLEITTDASFFVKSAASNFVETIAKHLSLIQSLDTILHFSKSVMLLLMDDEEEIRERNTKLVMGLVGDENRKVIPICAQELFIDFVIDKLPQIDRSEAMAIVLMIVISGIEGENSLDDNIEEYRVFDKNEVNLFSETFIIKKMCLSAIKTKLLGSSDTAQIDEIKSIIKATKKLSDCGSEAVIESCLNSL